MPNPALAIVGSSVVGGAASAYSGNKAAKAQQAASDQAAKVQWDMYDQTREDLQPYTQAGYGALDEYGRYTSPRATDAQLDRWGNRLNTVSDRAAQIQRRIDRREANGFTRGGTTTTTGGTQPTSGAAPATTSGGPTASGGNIASGMANGLVNDMFGEDVSFGDPVLDSAFGAGGGETATTPGDAKLNKLYDRLENVEGRRDNLKEKIENGSVGPNLRDPDNFESDPLYDQFKTESNPLAGDFVADTADIKTVNLAGREKFQAETNKFRNGRFDYQAPGAEEWQNSELYMDKPSWEFETSPGYQFRVDEATDTVTSDAASRGLRFSGDTLKALNREVQGIASDEYNNWHTQTAREQELHNQAYDTFKTDYRADFDTSMQGRMNWLAQRDADREWNYDMKVDDIDRRYRNTVYNNQQNDMDRLFNYNVASDDDNRAYRDNAYNSVLASGAWDRAYGVQRDHVNDLAQTVNWGMNAAGQTANAGMNAAANAGNAAISGGNATADGYTAAGNAFNNTLNSGWQAYGMMKGGYFDQYKPTPTP